MQLRIVIFGNDGRGSRNVHVNTATLIAVGTIALAALASILWLGWKIGELTARL